MEADTEHRLNTDVSQTSSIDIDMISSMGTPDPKAALLRETSSQPNLDNPVSIPAHDNEGRATPFTEFTALETKIEPASYVLVYLFVCLVE